MLLTNNQRNQAKILNDPSFAPLLTSGAGPAKTEKSFKPSVWTPVFIRKTEILTDADDSHKPSHKKTMPTAQQTTSTKPWL